MNFSSAVDLGLALFALSLLFVYVLGSGYFLYLVTPLAFAVSFEVAGWHGWSSIVSLLRVTGIAAKGYLLDSGTPKM